MWGVKIVFALIVASVLAQVGVPSPATDTLNDLRCFWTEAGGETHHPFYLQLKGLQITGLETIFASSWASNAMVLLSSRSSFQDKI